MSASTFLNQPLAAASINATGNTNAFALNPAFNNVLAQIEIDTAPTGTSPTITFQLQVSLDGVHFYNVGAATSALNAAGLTSLSNTGVNGVWARLSYVVAGTTPVFPSVTVNVYES